MLQFVIFKKPYRCFKTGTTLLFMSGVNLLVGDQGCGKSTLLEMMRTLTTANDDKLRSQHWRSISMNAMEVASTVALVVDPPMRTMGYDFERDSPRMAIEIQLHDVGRQMASMHQSHGQTTKPFLDGLTQCSEPFICFLDEPDQALSPRSCYDLVRLFRTLAAKGCQVIAAVHNPIVIRGVIPGETQESEWSHVIDLEHEGELVTADEFLAGQAGPRQTV